MEFHFALIILGGLFVMGLLTDAIGRYTALPRVTLLILLGVAVGPTGFDLLPSQIHDWFEILASVALAMVAFLLGGSLSRSQLQRHGRQILIVSVAVVVSTVVFTSAGLIALGVAPVLALFLSGIATATAPASTLDVIKETRTKGVFAQTLKGIVAIDDAWGLIVFSIMLAAADAWTGNGSGAVWQRGVWEVFGAISIGVAVGFPAAYLSGRLRSGEPMQTEALAIVFLCAGISIWLDVSYLLAGIVAGMVVVNFAKHHTRPFHEIENIERPFMILFFFLAGASLHSERWLELSWIVTAYIVLRIISRIFGGWVGGRICRAPEKFNRWIGIALMPQAGVAIGMALIAGNQFPDLRDIILSITIATTIVFEIFGPLATRIALKAVAKHPHSGGAHPNDPVA